MTKIFLFALGIYTTLVFAGGYHTGGRVLDIVPTSIHGEIRFSEKEVLPQPVYFRVQLVETVFADDSFNPVSSSRQVIQGGFPIAFTIPIDPDSIQKDRHYVIYAEIFDAYDQLLFENLRVVNAFDSGSTDNFRAVMMKKVAGLETASRQNRINTMVWRCRDLTLVARMGPGELAVFIPNRYMVLPQVAFGELIRFQEQDVIVTLNDDGADIEIAGVQYPNCQHDHRASIWEHAKLSGVSYRAVGNEPGWILELGKNNQAQWRYNYHEDVINTAMVEPDIDMANRHTLYLFDVDDQDLEIHIYGVQCNDTMSGESFSSRVEIHFGGQVYRGCGRSLH